MKTTIALLISVLLSTGTLAELSGSDDFNDNNRDPAKWAFWNPRASLLHETNRWLEFTSTGVGYEEDAWIWIPNHGSHIHDWSVTINAFNSANPPMASEPVAIGLIVANSVDFGDAFGISLISFGPLRFVASGWQINGIDYWDSLGALQEIPANSAKLRVSFDSTTKLLTSTYDMGGGFTTLTNFTVNRWGMDSNDTFTAGIHGQSDEFTVPAGQVYVDNYEAVTMPYSVVITNCHPGTTGFMLKWVPEDGWDSVVQWSPDLMQTPFVNLSETLPYPVNSYTDTAHAVESQCFYQVEVQLK